jgi:hypothetical protein
MAEGEFVIGTLSRFYFDERKMKMVKKYILAVALAGMLVMTGCAGKTQNSSEAGQTSAAVQSVSEELSSPAGDGVLVDYEKENLITMGDYQNIELNKDDLEDEDMTEEEMAGELAWETLVDESDVLDYPDSLVEEEFQATKTQYEDMAELLGCTTEELMEQFGIEDEDSFYEIAEDQVKQRMIAKTLMAKENLQMDEDTYTEYLMNYMEYTKKDGKTQEELVEEYTTDYGSRPKDDMYIEYAKNYLAGKANIQ